jgi:Fe-S cluster biosynthesis and repair protein YggX
MAAAQFDFDPSKILMAIIIVILMMALMSTCQTNLILHDDITELTNTNDEFTKRIYDDSVVVYSQKQTILNNETAIKMLQAEADKLRLSNVQELVKAKTKTIIKTEIKLADPVYIDSFPHLKLPREFSKQDKWFSIDGRINRLGLLQIDSMVSYGTLTYAVGDSARDGFISKILGRRDKVVRLSIDNPTMSITGMSNIYIRQERKWWESKGFMFAFGAIFGGGLMLYAAK